MPASAQPSVNPNGSPTLLPRENCHLKISAASTRSCWAPWPERRRLPAWRLSRRMHSVVRVHHGADVADIGLSGARLCGSGIGIGLQSKGTALIHKNGLAPLNNLELLSMAPNLTLDSYRALGRNAACYATNRAPHPVPMKVDNMARLRLIVHTTLLHHREVNQIDEGRAVEELEVRYV
ncbi:MAG: hypothetical protein CMQ61_07830 [Gammaproteobacteria bacterium]|nr:hypothetical protein [Gammaproteobacteria bacterium]